MKDPVKAAAREANRWRCDISVAPPEGANLTQTVHDPALSQQIVPNGPPAPEPEPEPETTEQTEPEPAAEPEEAPAEDSLFEGIEE